MSVLTEENKDIIKKEIYKAFIQSQPINNINATVLKAIIIGLEKADVIMSNRKE